MERFYLLNLCKNRMNCDLGGLLITKLNSSSTPDEPEDPSDDFVYLKKSLRLSNQKTKAREFKRQ